MQKKSGIMKRGLDDMPLFLQDDFLNDFCFDVCYVWNYFLSPRYYCFVFYSIGFLQRYWWKLKNMTRVKMRRKSGACKIQPVLADQRQSVVTKYLLSFFLFFCVPIWMNISLDLPCSSTLWLHLLCFMLRAHLFPDPKPRSLVTARDNNPT